MNFSLKKFIKTIHDYFVGYSYQKYVVKIFLCVALFISYILLVGDNAIENILGVVIGIIISFMLLNILRATLQHIEDDIKVSTDDKMLTEIYDTNKYLKSLNFSQFNKINFLYDAIYFHSEQNTITILDDPNKNFQLEELIENKFLEILKSHTGSYFRNYTTVRLDDFKFDSSKKELTLYTSRSSFFNHLVTNRAVDYRVDNFVSLRMIYDHSTTMVPLSKSVYSNHIGINALLFLNDGHFLIPHRAANSTISKNKITASIATRLVLSDFSKEMTLNALTSDNLKTYMKDHLFLPDNVIDNCRVEFLGFGRDIYEGGKPQFYYAIYTDLEAVEYATILQNCKPKKRTIDENRKIYIAKFASLSAQDGALSFQIYYKKNKTKTICFFPEKSFLSNLWHYFNKT